MPASDAALATSSDSTQAGARAWWRTLRGVLSSGLAELRVRPAQQEPALDALRSFAVLAVLCGHWATPEFSVHGGLPSPVQRWPLFVAGWSGVDLFFVLSGFLIGRQLWQELARTGDVRLGRFLLKRGFRIWPLYFVMLGFIALLKTPKPGWVDFVFLTNYLPNAMGRSWSLSTEEQFYIAVPLLLLLFKRRIPMLGYLAVFGAIEMSVLVARHVALVQLIQPGQTINDYYFELFAPFHTHLEGLLAGLVISLVATARPALFSPERTRGVSRLGLGVIALAFAGVLLLRRIDHPLFSFLELGLVFGSVTFWALLDHSWISVPLRLWMWYPISRLAYGMYLNHFWMTRGLNDAIVSGMRSLSGNEDIVFLGSLSATAAISVGIAVLTFVLVEHPFLLLRARWLDRSRASASRRPPEK